MTSTNQTWPLLRQINAQASIPTCSILRKHWPRLRRARGHFWYQKYEKLISRNLVCHSVRRMNSFLPHSIRHLYFSDDMAEYLNFEWDARACLDRLRKLIAGCDWLVPHLETITPRLRYSSEPQQDESQQGELKSLCAGAGLDFNIDKVDFVE